MIIVTGAQGQLGTDVVLELKKRNIEHIGIDINELDITDDFAVNNYLKQCKTRTDPDSHCVIHCAAYTAVDKAEDEPELCYNINEAGTENIAKACAAIDAEMIYISTDYVFDGSGETPFETDAVKNPLCVYGKSKLAGEQAVLKHLAKHYIVRTSWVFGQHGQNFVKTMLKLAEERDEISVVCDQTGSPTYTPDLAKLLCDMALSGKYGVYHATNEGDCTWAQFAEEIVNYKQGTKIIPVTSDQYKTKAVRPKNSRLSKKSLDAAGFNRLPTWQDALKHFMQLNS